MMLKSFQMFDEILFGMSCENSDWTTYIKDIFTNIAKSIKFDSFEKQTS